jgi:hypothetical protein
MTTIQRRHLPASSCAAFKKSDTSRVDPASKSAMMRRISAGKQNTRQHSLKNKRVEPKNIEKILFLFLDC